jgi:hypothetical protein
MTSISPLKKYTTQLAIAGLCLAVVSSLGNWFKPEWVHSLWFILLLFVAGVQWLVFAFVIKFAQHKPQTLIRQYQTAKYAKLFVYLIALATYVFAVKTNAMEFLITFMVYYVVFTALETWFFHRWMNTLPRTNHKDVE